MFWGLIMEPQRRYTQKVKKSFHISMASLDVSTSTDEPAQVMCGFEGRNYLLCTLRKPDLLQCALDLNFEVGDELSLAANGKCHVHLTGYLTDDFNEMDDENEMDDDNEMEEGGVDEEEEVEVEEKQKKKSKKSKKEVQNGPPAKKSKVANSDDEEESDTDIRAFLQKSLAETDEDDVTFTSDDEAADEEDDNDDDDESDDLEDEEEEAGSSLSEGDSDEKEVEEPPKSKSKKNKLNGVPNKQEKQEPPVTPKQKEKEKNKKKEQTEIRSPQKEQSPSKKKTLQGGVLIEDIREGQGLPAKPGKYISVYYEGRLKSNNKVFDSTTKGPGFSFRLGSGEVIKGWDVGVQGMKVGGKRRITCPPPMAYGAKGSPPAIPANSVLVFEVELKKVR